MKPLKTTQRMLTWLRVLPANKNASKWQKCSYLALVLVLIITAIAVFSSSLLYVMKFKSVEFADTLMAFRQLVAATSMANSIVVAYFLRHKIPSIFDKLSEIYEKCMV